MRTPLGLIHEENNIYTVFFTAYTNKEEFSEIGMVKLKLLTKWRLLNLQFLDLLLIIYNKDFRIIVENLTNKISRVAQNKLAQRWDLIYYKNPIL